MFTIPVKKEALLLYLHSDTGTVLQEIGTRAKIHVATVGPSTELLEL